MRPNISSIISTKNQVYQLRNECSLDVDELLLIFPEATWSCTRFSYVLFASTSQQVLHITEQTHQNSLDKISAFTRFPFEPTTGSQRKSLPRKDLSGQTSQNDRYHLFLLVITEKTNIWNTVRKEDNNRLITLANGMNTHISSSHIHTTPHRTARTHSY